ncbi:MAG: hypothetical protein ABSD88_18915, partial [Candidatus Korobacteraceae bacterium]
MNKAIIIFFLLGCVVAGMVSCGGTNSTLVIISPSAITLTTGGTQQFTANIPVTWSVSGDGVINSAGFFIAGGTPGAATVTATATDKVSNNSAVVTVVATGTTTTTTTGVSGLKHRVFVSNAFPGTLNAGALNIIDADKDQLSAAIITLGGSPNFMVQSADQKGVVVFDSSSNILRLVADSAEAVAGAVQLPGATSSMLVGGSLAGNNVAAYAAVPTAHVFDASHNVVTGAVYLAQFSGSTPLMSAGVQGAKAVAGGTITVITTVGTTTTTAFYNNFLVFSQNCDTVTALQNGSAGLALNTLGTVNGGAACPVNDGTGTFSRPVGGVFAFSVDANNNVNATTAYVLSSGA